MMGSANVRDQNLVITLPEDVLAPTGAMPSAGKVLNIYLPFFLLNFVVIGDLSLHLDDHLTSFNLVVEIWWNIVALQLLIKYCLEV